MDVLLWVGWLCTLVVLMFTALIVLFGALALKAPDWDQRFLGIAHREWKRRGLADRRHSISEELHMQRFVGPKQVADEPDADLRSRAISTIAVLIGADNLHALESQLNKRSEVLLRVALTNVVNSVRNISNLNVASHVWAVRRRAALSAVLWRGLTWFLPRCFRQVAKKIERYMVVATILGVAGGLFIWGFGSGSSAPPEGGIAWVNFVGIVVTVGTVAALVLAVGQQFLRVAVAVAGSARTWTRRGIAITAVALLFVIGVFTWVRTGLWEQWQQNASEFFTRSLTNTPLGHWIGGILLIATLIFAIHRTLGWVRARQIKARDRVAALATAIVLALMGLMVALYILNAPKEAVLPAIYAAAWTIALSSLLYAIFSAVEWFGKYRALNFAGVAIRRGWFRWWALWTWCGVAFALLLLTSIPPSAYAALRNTPLYLPVNVVILFIGLAVSLSFWPGVVTVVRFVIRVHNAYTSYEVHSAGTHSTQQR